LAAETYYIGHISLLLITSGTDFTGYRGCDIVMFTGPFGRCHGTEIYWRHSDRARELLGALL